MRSVIAAIFGVLLSVSMVTANMAYACPDGKCSHGKKECAHMKGKKNGKCKDCKKCNHQEGHEGAASGDAAPAAAPSGAATQPAPAQN